MKFLKLVFILSLVTVRLANAQNTTIVVSAKMIDKLSDQVDLGNMNGWIFRRGNNTSWAQPDIDTTGWIKMAPAGLSKKYADKNGRVEGWFRVKVKFDSSLLYKKLWIDSPTWAATEFYVDGRLTTTRGNTGDYGKPFEDYNGGLDPLSITFENDTVHTFALHFAG